MWANKSICSYSDFNLAYVAEFQYKAGYAKKKPVGMETLDTHFLLTVYILYKRTKFHSNIDIYCLHFTKPQSRIFLWCREHLCNWPKNQSFAQWWSSKYVEE